MKSKQNKKFSNRCLIDTYSSKNTNYFIKLSSKRRKQRIKAFLREAVSADVIPNFTITIVWHALQTAGDRRDGHILGMPSHKRQEHLMRKLRTLGKRLGFSTVYVWIRSGGNRMGDHLHMALYWRRSEFLNLVKFMEAILGSDVDHETNTRGYFFAESQCKGWQMKEIVNGLAGALGWGEYLAFQRINTMSALKAEEWAF